MAKDKLIPSVDYKICMACRVCVTACPFSSLEADKTGLDSYGKVFPSLARPETCTGCGICAGACPVDAIIMVPLTHEG